MLHDAVSKTTDDHFAEDPEQNTSPIPEYEEQFVWNHFLLETAFGRDVARVRSPWVLPLIHGFIEQASMYSYVDELKRTSKD
jgi:hypothetical protein